MSQDTTATTEAPKFNTVRETYGCIGLEVKIDVPATLDDLIAAAGGDKQKVCTFARDKVVAHHILGRVREKFMDLLIKKTNIQPRLKDGSAAPVNEKGEIELKDGQELEGEKSYLQYVNATFAKQEEGWDINRLQPLMDEAAKDVKFTLEARQRTGTSRIGKTYYEAADTLMSDAAALPKKLKKLGLEPNATRDQVAGAIQARVQARQREQGILGLAGLS